MRMIAQSARPRAALPPDPARTRPAPALGAARPGAVLPRLRRGPRTAPGGVPALPGAGVRP
ncbi:hypothetical protein GCM10009605_04690 [Nocardiopsis composta]